MLLQLTVMSYPLIVACFFSLQFYFIAIYERRRMSYIQSLTPNPLLGTVPMPAGFQYFAM